MNFIDTHLSISSSRFSSTDSSSNPSFELESFLDISSQPFALSVEAEENDIDDEDNDDEEDDEMWWKMGGGGGACPAAML